MRTLWKGAVSFGLVHIPVRVYPATESKAVKFRLLHRPCLTPIRYMKWCPTCGREVAPEELVDGYEFEKERFVVLEEQDFERLPSVASRVIDIVDFVELSEIDPVYYDRPYYLEPAEGGLKAYCLLRRVMLETGRVAVAKVALKTRQSLAAVRVMGQEVLVMETMYWPDEVRSYAGLEGLGPEPPFHENELRMARLLVTNLSAPFDPARYTDDYRAALHEAIRAKVEGRQVHEYREPETTRVQDLLEALRASVEAVQSARDRGGGGRGPEDSVGGPGAGRAWEGTPH